MHRHHLAIVAIFLGLIGNVVAMAPASNPATVEAATDPIAHWTFDEVGATTASDASGNGHAGAVLQ